MKTTLRLIISVLFLLAASQYIKAYNIKKLGVVDGMSNNNVISIDQDNDGFIWIATKNGLNRFDCSSFTTFLKSDTDSNSICSNVLNCVLTDKYEPIVWIASEKNGIDSYNYKTHSFKHYENNPNDKHSLIANGITHIAEAKNGNIWLATYNSGIDYFDKKTGKFTHYNQSNISGLASDYNWYVMPDDDNKLYVGHVNEGMSIIDINSKTAINFLYKPNNPNSLPSKTVTCIYKDKNKNIWVGTRDGLCLFDPQTNTFKQILHDPNNSYSISNNFIKSFIEKNENELWIGTEGGGINILNLNKITNNNFDPKKLVFKHIRYANLPSGLSSSSVQTMIKDSYGNVWLGGFVGGVNFIPKEESTFQKIEFLPLIENKNSLPDLLVPGLASLINDNILVANIKGGISTFNKKEKIKHISHFRNKKIIAFSLFKVSNNYCWIGTEDGHIYKYYFNNEKIEELFEIIELKNIRLYSLFEDSSQNLWISTDKGVYRYNLKNKNYLFYNTNNSIIADNNSRSIIEDSNGLIWIGTLGGGLMVFDKNMNLKHNYGKYFDFFSIHNIYMDSRQRIWVCSQNDLFLFFNYNSNSVWRIGKKDGLAENTISAIIEGKNDHEFWLSTQNGLSLLDLSNKQIKNYTVNDGIVMGDYIDGSVTKTSDGTIYFGSQHGISFFNEKDIQQEIPAPLPNITNFSIPGSQNKNLNIFEDIPFDQTIQLSYKLNSFQIKFNVLNYAITDKVEFMFQMAGLDNNWYYLNDDKQVTFRNLAPGEYTFNVKTKKHNLDWPKKQTSLSIIIDPPIWLTWWAKILYIIIFFSIGLFIMLFYKKKLQLENTIILEKKKHQQEIQLNEEKVKFFTNITHELRTPMTLILGPLEDLILDNNIPQKYAGKINNIHKVANRLLQLINQILEFRKSETQSRKLSVLKEDFVKFFHETCHKYAELNHNKNIDFQFHCTDEEILMFYDPEVVSIIMDNLISNAIKYTSEGYVKLELKRISEGNINYTEIIVEDTGYGISEKDLPFIFDRYFQAKHVNHQISGSGIGLDLVKKMVDLHEAEISVSSIINKGTSFTLRFVTDNTYPEAIHMDDEEIINIEEDNDNDKNVILVVEDNPEIAEYIEQSLSDDYNVQLAYNGKTGIEKAFEIIPDIIISDVMMPIMDGNEMCRNIKNDMRTCHIPIVMLTAKDSVKDKSEGYEAGADSYLTKPFSATLLKSRLKNIIDNRRKLSESTASKLNDKKYKFAQSTNKLDNEFFENINSIILENLDDENLNVSQIASIMNMSHSTLYRKVKALTNLTINEYLRKLRMKEAESLLQTNKYNITEVMYKVGINSSGYFRQCFKKEFGMNPSDYIQKLKE